MKKYLETRYLFLVLLLVSLLLLAACSSGANFIVVNASDSAIEVRYKAKLPSTVPPVNPGVLPISQLGEQVPWRDLSASEFTFDPDTRTVVVSVKPGYALLIDNLPGEDDAQLAADLSIVEIDIKGASGEMSFQDEQVFKHFMAGAKGDHILTYK